MISRGKGLGRFPRHIVYWGFSLGLDLEMIVFSGLAWALSPGKIVACGEMIVFVSF